MRTFQEAAKETPSQYQALADVIAFCKPNGMKTFLPFSHFGAGSNYIATLNPLHENSPKIIVQMGYADAVGESTQSWPLSRPLGKLMQRTPFGLKRLPLNKYGILFGEARQKVYASAEELQAELEILYPEKEKAAKQAEALLIPLLTYRLRRSFANTNEYKAFRKIVAHVEKLSPATVYTSTEGYVLSLLINGKMVKFSTPSYPSPHDVEKYYSLLKSPSCQALFYPPESMGVISLTHAQLEINGKTRDIFYQREGLIQSDEYLQTLIAQPHISRIFPEDDVLGITLQRKSAQTESLPSQEYLLIKTTYTNIEEKFDRVVPFLFSLPENPKESIPPGEFTWALTRQTAQKHNMIPSVNEKGRGLSIFTSKNDFIRFALQLEHEGFFAMRKDDVAVDNNMRFIHAIPFITMVKPANPAELHGNYQIIGSNKSATAKSVDTRLNGQTIPGIVMGHEGASDANLGGALLVHGMFRELLEEADLQRQNQTAQEGSLGEHENQDAFLKAKEYLDVLRSESSLPRKAVSFLKEYFRFTPVGIMYGDGTEKEVDPLHIGILILAVPKDPHVDLTVNTKEAEMEGAFWSDISDFGQNITNAEKQGQNVPTWTKIILQQAVPALKQAYLTTLSRLTQEDNNQ